MKDIAKIVFIFLSVNFTQKLSGQSPFVMKKIAIPSTTSGYSWDLAETSPNNFFLIGTTYKQIGSNIHNQLTVAGIDDLGNFQWSKSYGNNNFNYLPTIGSFRMLIKSSGYLYSILSARDSNNRQCGIFIKFDQNGDTIWQKKHYENAGQDVYYYSITPTVENAFLICGVVQTNAPTYNGHPTLGLNIRKTDSGGIKIWDRIFYTADLDYAKYGIDILQDSVSKNIFVTGTQTSNLGSYGFLMILDSLGNLKSDLGSNSSPYFSNMIDVIQTRDGNYVAAGVLASSLNTYGYTNSLSSVVKFDPQGNVIFSKTYDTLDVYNANCKIVELPSGNLIVAGAIDCLMNYKPAAYNGLIRIMKLDKDGNLLFKKYYDNVTQSDNMDIPLGLQVTSDNNIAFTTVFRGSTLDPVYFTFYKTDTNYCDPNAMGCYATGIEDLGENKYKINVFPNPATNMLNLNSSEAGVFSLIEIGGRVVYQQKANSGSSQIDIKEIPAGMYIVQLQTDQGMKREKIMISR